MIYYLPKNQIILGKPEDIIKYIFEEYIKPEEFKINKDEFGNIESVSKTSKNGITSTKSPYGIKNEIEELAKKINLEFTIKEEIGLIPKEEENLNLFKKNHSDDYNKPEVLPYTGKN